jgi:hypothetical protein
MTPEEKAAAIAVLDANISSEQSVGGDGKYVQVRSYSPDGTHTIRLDEYVMPVGPPSGVGYCRYVSVPEDGDPDLINAYADPFGPSPWPSGWTSGRIPENP